MTILNNLVMATLILSTTFLIIPSPVHASTCTYSEKYYKLPQIFTLSSYVFAGTVTTINNDTGHKWNVNFSIEKLWKSTSDHESLTVITNSLQGCGYSITPGNKYLVYAISSPPFLQMSWTKAYVDAQSDISLLNDPNFQENVKTKEDLNVKLEAAKAIIENMMISNTSGIPFNGVSIDVINSTLNISIDNTKSMMSKEEYEKKIKDILGDVPIKIEFAQYVAGTGGTDGSTTKNLSPLLSTMHPLKQLKSGIAAQDVQCNQGFQLIFKVEDGSPACVKPTSVQKLVEWGWAKLLLS